MVILKVFSPFFGRRNATVGLGVIRDRSHATLEPGDMELGSWVGFI